VQNLVWLVYYIILCHSEPAEARLPLRSEASAREGLSKGHSELVEESSFFHTFVRQKYQKLFASEVRLLFFVHLSGDFTPSLTGL